MVVSSAATRDEWGALRLRLESRLADLVPDAGDRLARSMRHSLLAPGKRLRPLMELLAVDALAGDVGQALDVACALEMVHTASLIVDDLPCMDDAALRRGRRTTHNRYGVEVAVLAAVSLLNRAPRVIAASQDLDDSLRLRLIESLSSATGASRGLAAGQMEDLRARREATDLAALGRIVERKTASLFVCAAESGAMIAGAGAPELEAMRRFATCFGVAFQILDDVADAVGSVDELRKDVGQDAAKATHVSVLGAGRALDLARRKADAARAELRSIGLAEGSLARLCDTALAARGAGS